MTNLLEIFVGKIAEKTQRSRPKNRLNSRVQDNEKWRILVNMAIITGMAGLPVCSKELL